MKAKRKIEKLIGRNEAIVKQILGREVHCGASYLTAARAVFAKIKRETRRACPRPLRRGLVQCILKTHRQNKELYQDVMSGNLKRKRVRQ